MGATLNGLFNFYTNEKMKGYYPFWMFSKLYQLGTAVESSSDRADVYVVAATDGTARAVMLTYFTNDPEAKPREVTLAMENAPAAFNVLLLDDTHDAEQVASVQLASGMGKVTLSPNSVVLLREP